MLQDNHKNWAHEGRDTYLMNIFILDKNVETSVSYYMDTHVNKILLEACQVACSAHHLAVKPRNYIPYKLSHANHPVCRWARESIEHYWKVVDYAEALRNEYHHRYGKNHGCTKVVYWLQDNEPMLPDYYEEVIPLAVDPQAKSIYQARSIEESVETYRYYYAVAKQHLAKWTNRPRPSWYPPVKLSNENKEQQASIEVFDDNYIANVNRLVLL